MRWLFALLTVLLTVAPAMAGEDPYIAVVGNDINANQFYLSPKYVQFLHDQTIAQIPTEGETFSTNAALIQPEVCDVTGIAQGRNNTPPFIFRGNFNGRINSGGGWFQWVVALPKKPSGEINLCIQCGILKPNAFTFNGFRSVLNCAAETGERVANGLCAREEVDAGSNPIITTALPKIVAVALPGPYNPVDFTPFNLTAFRNPGSYDPFAVATPPAPLVNHGAAQLLDGMDNGTRILLKSCMDKCIVVKLPVTGQVNAAGQIEYDLEAGDLIFVQMNIPGGATGNTVDIYCHQESLKVMGIGEATF